MASLANVLKPWRNQRWVIHRWPQILVLKFLTKNCFSCEHRASQVDRIETYVRLVVFKSKHLCWTPKKQPCFESPQSEHDKLPCLRNKSSKNSKNWRYRSDEYESLIYYCNPTLYFFWKYNGKPEFYISTLKALLVNPNSKIICKTHSTIISHLEWAKNLSFAKIISRLN